METDFETRPDHSDDRLCDIDICACSGISLLDRQEARRQAGVLRPDDAASGSAGERCVYFVGRAGNRDQERRGR